MPYTVVVLLEVTIVHSQEFDSTNDKQMKENIFTLITEETNIGGVTIRRAATFNYTSFYVSFSATEQ